LTRSDGGFGSTKALIKGTEDVNFNKDTGEKATDVDTRGILAITDVVVLGTRNTPGIVFGTNAVVTKKDVGDSTTPV
jgi:hypothetical protein